MIQPTIDKSFPASSDSPFAAIDIHTLLQRQPPQWLVEGLLTVGGLGLLYGSPGLGKTFLALYLALCVALGKPWFGRRTQQGGVLVIASEGALELRMRALLQERQLSARDLANIRFIASPPDLLNREQVAAFKAACIAAATEMGGVSLVILDPLSNSMPGGDENMAHDMSRIVHELRDCCAALSGCALLVIAHPGKAADRGVRGHSCLRGALDMELVVTSQRDSCQIKATKVRDGEVGVVGSYNLKVVALDPPAQADWSMVASSCVVEEVAPTPASNTGLLALFEAHAITTDGDYRQAFLRARCATCTSPAIWTNQEKVLTSANQR